ncbi:PD-(D/E)XK nuclease family protein [Fructobacillus sp. CRL 2054]|uniref:PD-(D/E)XK nuclease family protein n=1 Tax=Fructobacillus sp. CRL 2054 TaxID=2763007 RepID=UPI0023788AA0|nr:PD-(D/E)XK nuclease family protein [Fructobacillus sp. CRL 2054]MDD9138223.1 PD-(D/E)XK nuclease family protein [Fructobacillus sp. CRL 2054]
MTVTVNIATGEVDSRAHFVSEIKEKIRQGERRRIFYIVPNHVKFDSEVDVLSRLASAGGQRDGQHSYAQSQVQVYSLSRLAWRLLEDEGMVQPPVLGEAGLFVMVSDILHEEKGRLPIFARMAAKRGFIEKLVAQLAELRASRVTPEELLNIVSEIDTSNDQQKALNASALQQKLRDLAVVADAFNKKMGNDYLLAQETLPYFVEQMKNPNLTDSIFYFDGFTGFTAAEWSLVQLLVQHTDVNFALLGNVDAADPLKYEQAGSVFDKPLETARTIRALATTADVDFTVKVLNESTNQVQVNTRTNLLRAWEKIGAYRDFSADEKQKQVTNLNVFVGANVVTELEEVARRIREDLRGDANLHLRDILVLARDLNPYAKHLPAVMDSFDLSYFLDNDVKMGNHPLVELTTTLLANPSVLYQKDKILTILKTGYLRPVVDGELMDSDTYFEAVSYLENYLDGHRVARRTWQDDSAEFALFKVEGNEETAAFSEDQAVNNLINTLKRFVHHLLDALTDAFAEVKTIEESARALMTFLQEEKLPEAVLEQRDDLTDAGELMKAQQLQEVWQLFTKILEQLVAVAGDEDFARSTFLSALQAGFSGGTFSGIPNQLDQLTISEAGIVQSQKYKKLYFIGATRSALPAQANNKSLLSDQDRLMVQPALADQADPRYLQESAQQQMASESLLFYNALQTAADSVTMSYPLLDQDGNVNEPSPYLMRLAHAFGLNEDDFDKVTAQADGLVDLVENYAGTASATLSQLVKLPTDENDKPTIQRLLRSLDEAGYADKAKRVLASHDYDNTPENLKPELAKELFGGPLVLSISQVESFYRNPYEYFLKYGLHLNEKPTAEIDNRTEGTVYHAIFEKTVNQVISQQERLADATNEEISKDVNAALQLLLTDPAYSELTEEGQGIALAKAMNKQANKVLQNLRDVSRLSAASQPTAVEEGFGLKGGGLPTIELKDGQHSVKLRGKVDRFDRQDAVGDFGTIIDYKLSGKTFKYADAANGLELQLLAYWQAVNENNQKLGLATNGQVGGAFFAPINDQQTAYKDFKGNFDELFSGDLKAPGNKLRGLYLDDEDYADSLDNVDRGEASSAYAMKKNKSKAGYDTKSSDFITTDNLDLLMRRNRELILDAAEKIENGQFDLSPAKNALTYSKYLDVMRFDAALNDKYQNFRYSGQKGPVMKALTADYEAEDAEKENGHA